MRHRHRQSFILSISNMSIDPEKIISSMADTFSAFMERMGLDLWDPSLKETPMRVAKMFVKETCSWLFNDPPKITSFPNEWDRAYDGMVLIKDIEVKSLCEHHFQPFIGKCHIAYIPGKTIIWLSKFSRIVRYRAKRPQVQERLTMDIFNHLKEILDTEDIAVLITAEHLCMKLRGVEEHQSSTTTAKLWGEFYNMKVREEFYNLIK
jgi:GTP cyclohydrolase I